MECYGEKMLPNGLPELIYQVTPDKIRERLKVIVYPKKKEKYLHGSCGYDGTTHKIKLYPTVIMNNVSGPGVLSYNYWLEFLRITLHEIGHAVDHASGRERIYKAQNISDRMYKENDEVHAYIEKYANDWCKQTTDKIASRDPRMGQPTRFIGGLPGIYLLRNKQDHWKFRDNYRAYRVGGQYTLTQLIQVINNHYRIYDFEIQKHSRRMIKKEIDKIGFNRIYVDNVSRKHLFFNHGEMLQLTNKIIGSGIMGRFEVLYHQKQEEASLKRMPSIIDDDLLPF